MEKVKRSSLILILVLTLSIFLSACGGQETAEPTDTEDTAQEVTQVPAYDEAEATTAPEATSESESDEAAKPETGSNSTASLDNLVSDLGFRPDKNGFSFENYGGDAGVQNLTPAELERMFGEKVCANKENGECVLTPTGDQWLEQTNEAMSGGHCEGMATLSLLLYGGNIKPDEFGGSDAHDLSLSNQSLQRELAYWWATQSVDPTYNSVIKGTPNEILDILKGLEPGGETYTIGIYKRDGSGGHAITPFGVQDEGNGIYSVLAYDNNYPNEIRKLQIDSNQNTWSYEASINPQEASELYEGDADTQSLDLTPTSAREGQQACPFCADESTAKAGNGLAAVAPKYNQIYLDGDGHLLIEDEAGHQLGYIDGKMVNTIPGAQVQQLKVDATSSDAPEPIYLIPEDVDVNVTIDGSSLKEPSKTSLEMIGPGFSIGVEDISLDPNQKDVVSFFPKDESIVYDTDGSEAPSFVVTIENPGSYDYEFDVAGTDMEGGGTITLVLDTKSGDLLINTEKLKNEGKFTFDMTRYSDTDEETYTAEDIALKAGAVVYVNYADWKGDQSGLTFGVDTNGDGTIEDEYTTEDSK
jgi:hypothetical protein